MNSTPEGTNHIVCSVKDIENVILNNDNSKNCLISSNIPEVCKSNPCILGIDEAGRGPVLGPMVYGTSFCPLLENEEKLKKLGCADSKVLTESKRDSILDSICAENDWLGWMIEIISPNTICNSMLRRQKYSLNEVSHDSAIGLIRRALDSGVNVREVYVDTVGPAESYQKKLSEIFPEQIITVSSKADSKYPIVSAASICAKVSRDLALKCWTFHEGIKIDEDNAWGSGYPNDPVTKKFLSENIDPVFGFPQIVRFSWSTASKILKEKSVLIEGDDIDDEEEEEQKKTTFITKFFKPKDENGEPKTTTRERHAFFKERCLNVCSDL